MIEVNDLVKRYGDHVAVDHLSFRVEQGQIYGFLGPNGAGKSTTMNIITGYLATNKGTVVINGHDILEEPEKAKKCIGYLPEQPPLYVDMTVKECLEFVSELRNVPKTERKDSIYSIMDKLGLLENQNRLVKNLSKGYKQRVGLAQALIGNPEILILDEPTVGLDPKQITEIRQLIKELSKEHTIILSSHILSEVSALCDQVLIISHGKLVAWDTPEGLRKSMSGTTTLKLQIADSEKKFEDAFKENFGEEIQVTGQWCEGMWSGNIEIEGEQDIREELFYLLAKIKCPILELTQSKMSLEDIFLELTQGEHDTGKKDELADEEEWEEALDYYGEESECDEGNEKEEKTDSDIAFETEHISGEEEDSIDSNL